MAVLQQRGLQLVPLYFLGYFREDYVFTTNADETYLDEHNGRFCITPEYPNGTYAYFCTVDDKLELYISLCSWANIFMGQEPMQR